MQLDIENHIKEFPNSVAMFKQGRWYFHFFLGQNYKSKTGYYGSYPPGFLPRIRSLFPGEKRILHLFSGSVDDSDKLSHEEWTVDINQELCPDVCCKAEDVAQHFEEGFFSLVFSDPPYDKINSEKYGYKMPNVPKVFRELHKIVRPGGIVVWLSTVPPLCRTRQPGAMWRLVGVASVRVSQGKVIRNVDFLERI